MPATLVSRFAADRVAPVNGDRNGDDRPQIGPVDLMLLRISDTVDAIDLLQQQFLTLRGQLRKLPDWARPDEDLAQLERQLATRLRSLDCVRDRLASWPRG